MGTIIDFVPFFRVSFLLLKRLADDTESLLDISDTL